MRPGAAAYLALAAMAQSAQGQTLADDIAATLDPGAVSAIPRFDDAEPFSVVAVTGPEQVHVSQAGRDFLCGLVSRDVVHELTVCRPVVAGSELDRERARLAADGALVNDVFDALESQGEEALFAALEALLAGESCTVDLEDGGEAFSRRLFEGLVLSFGLDVPPWDALMESDRVTPELDFAMDRLFDTRMERSESGEVVLLRSGCPE